jgi:MFS superfamily sulfate permease-like transporter
MPPHGGKVQERAWFILTSLPEVNRTTAILGLAALAILFVGARFAPRIPWGLLVLVGSILLSSGIDLTADGVATVGPVPQGLPPIGLPGIAASDLPSIAFGGMALAMVGLAEGLSAARLFAAREGYEIHTNQELLATGAANIAAGISGGMGVAGSLSKTAASRRAGGVTQLAGVAAAVIALIAIASLTGLLAPLPRAVLSAIVIQAVWGLMDVSALRRYRHIRRNDFSAAIAAMIGVLVLGPLYGLLVAIGLAVLGLVYRSSRVETDIMGKVPGEKAAWGSVDDHPERRTYDGVIVLRLDVPLFWANATEIHDRVLGALDERPGTNVLLLDLEATSQLDTTSIDMLELLLTRLRERGIDLYLVRVFYRARLTLAKAGFIELLGEDRMWHSISAGVRAARSAQGITGKAHPQMPIEPADSADAADDEADLGDEPAAERIVVDHDVSAPAIAPDTDVAPRGGYQDPGRRRS